MKNTKKIVGRRELNYTDFNDLLADIERVVAEPHQAIGNWTAGEIIDHVAKPIPWAMDGYPEGFKVPLMFKIVGPLMKKSFLAHKPPPAGIKPPKKLMEEFEPEKSVSIDTAMQRLRDAIARWPQSTTIPKNPLVGSMTKQEWERFLTNHASLHFSFIVPA
ncbi:MAG: DUF1569 domain-containing protein [Planctomycetota bacterium]